MTQQPTILLVPGSFASPKIYTSWLSNAKSSGLNIQVITTPSVGRKPAGKPPGTMADDVQAIIIAAEPLLNAGQQVILMTHSYGGIPGTQSLASLSRKARSAAGKAGGIDTVIYLTSVVLPVGASSWDMSQGEFPNYLTYDDEYMTIDPAGNAPLCFNDLPADAALSAAKEFSEHATGSFKEKLTYAGYSDVESVYYVLCEDDKIIPPEAQAQMIGLVNGIRGEGKDVREVRIAAGHCPTHSRPDELTKIVAEIVKGVQ